MSTSAAEALVEVDDSLIASQAAGYLVELCREQALLCGEHFKICAVGVYHQVVGVLDGFFEVGALCFEYCGTLSGGCVGAHGVGHFGSSTQQCMLKAVEGLCLLCLGGL